MRIILIILLLVVFGVGVFGVWWVWEEMQMSKTVTNIKPTAIYLHEGCKPTYKVETGPELTASQNYSQFCYGKNKDDCSKVDVYNKLKNDFSQPDGLPDCEWGLLDSVSQ